MGVLVAVLDVVQDYAIMYAHLSSSGAVMTAAMLVLLLVAGLFEALLGPEDAVISDELNHASIIDGIRLCKAQRYR